MTGVMSGGAVADEQVSAIVGAVAAALSQRAEDVGRDIRESITSGIPELRGDERLIKALAASVEANVVTMFHVLAESAAIDDAVAPPAVIGYARRLAQHGVPQNALVRACRVCHARFLGWCLRELDGFEAPHGDLAAAARAMVEASFEYIDQVSEQVALAYEAERDRWSRNHGAAQRDRVREVLAGETVDITGSERLLGYRFEQRHLGAVVWCRNAGCANAMPELERTSEWLAARAGSTVVQRLFVPVDDSTAWAWFASATVNAGATSFEDAEPGPCGATRLAVGTAASGIEGFRQTFREATRAHSVAMHAGEQGPRVVRFDEIAPIAALSTDLDFARIWVRTTLGDLARADMAHERLRETALTFLGTGASYTAAADALHVHKNTVHYRIQQAEDILGRPLRDSRIELELALLACKWMRGAVLSGS